MNTAMPMITTLPETGGADQEGPPGMMKHLPSILWQRRWLIILPAVACLIAGTVAAFVIDPLYSSKATIVIESPQLPGDLVATPATDQIDQRIARIRQEVLSRPDLIEAIRANNLYPEMRGEPFSQIVETMREATAIDLISADVGGRGGQSNLVAFSIGFTYSDPNKAKTIVQRFVDGFVNLDATRQAEQAVGAANFLNQQSVQIRRQIDDVERQISQIKTANGAILTLGQMATGDPVADIARLDAEITSVRADNARLVAMPGPTPSSMGNVAAIEAQLRMAESRYSESHPDVLSLRAQLAAERAAAAAAPVPVNPAAAQIAANNQQISALQAAKGLLAAQSSSARSAQARAPAVAAQVEALERQAEGLRAQYQVIGSRLMTAQVSAKMETEQKGERMSIADPPSTPDQPVWPNRPLMIAGGLFGGLGIGVGLALLLELLFRPMRGVDSVRYATGATPLAVIPLLDRKPNILVRLLGWWSTRKTVRAG